MKKHRLLLGAHMSVAGGLEKAFERAESIHCTAMQIFTKSNRQWHAKKITPEEAALFVATDKKSSIAITITHATYLINIGSADSAIRKKSIDGLIDELDRCHVLQIPYLVLHPGSSAGGNPEECLDTIVESLNIAFSKTTSQTTVLLEIMAGQGSVMCYTFEQLAYILQKNSYHHRLGVCLDTCHAFAAGYDFRTSETYGAMWKQFDQTIGLKNLKAIHLNDSKKGLGSRVDRHEEIGKGALGLEPFRLLMNDKHLFDIPKVLETPNDSLEDYANNMQVLMELLSRETREKLEIKEK